MEVFTIPPFFCQTAIEISNLTNRNQLRGHTLILIGLLHGESTPTKGSTVPSAWYHLTSTLITRIGERSHDRRFATPL